MPKRRSKRKEEVVIGSPEPEVFSPPKRSKDNDEEDEEKEDAVRFDSILSEIASQSTGSVNPWGRKDGPQEDTPSVKEEFSVEPGLMSDSSSEEEDEKEDSRDESSSSSSQNQVIEIRIQGSNDSTNKEKKHSQKLRLAIQREAKRIQFLIHRVRFLSSAAHLLHVERILRESNILQAISLSLFPKAHQKPSPSPVDISSFVKWYHSAASVYPHNSSSSKPMTSILASSLPRMEFSSFFESTLGLYCLSLSMGWNTRLLTAPSEEPKNNNDNRHWCEIWTSDERWTIVDAFSGKTGNAKELEKRLSPFWYILAVSPGGFLKDLTPKYATNYVTSLSKKRKPHEEWIQGTLRPYLSRSHSSQEEKELDKILNEAPIPSSLSSLRGHPLYVTPRTLGKFEVIHPSSVKPVGMFQQKEPVYKRIHVHKLRSLISWQKDGMDVRKGERPRLSEKDKTFWGSWQVERFVPPSAKDGKVPKNDFGNVEVYKPWMVPQGTVHIPISGISRVAKKLGIDFGPAVIGWDYHMRGSHPVVDGIIVCSEFQDLLMDAWNNDEDAKTSKHFEKKQLRILNNWRKLTRGLILRERFNMKYKT
eukprot:TRINITY_DN18639_c0_g1_i1.p1 TRINITY_DN18639_c0_g1~~TRINITY_DN18639_c0_g1_i1.p1  ORF type:complete len:589 (+),score=158.89 TRINITY_DN18639_c0_g1_i1:36-1802(+)